MEAGWQQPASFTPNRGGQEMAKEFQHDGATNSNHWQCAGGRSGRLGHGGNRAGVGGRRGGLGVAAAALSAGPALVGKAVVTLLSEDEMIEKRNAEEFTRLTEPLGQDAVFGTRRDVTGGVIVGTNPGAGVHQDQWFEDFARMDDGQIERAGGDHINPDQTMFRVETTDEELFPIEPGKQRPEDGRSTFRRMDRFRSWNGAALTHERDAISRDAVFPNRAQWPSTVRGTERAINGHVRLLLKVCSSPTLH